MIDVDDALVLPTAHLAALALAERSERLLALDGGVGLLHIGMDLETARRQLEQEWARTVPEGEVPPAVRLVSRAASASRTVVVRSTPWGEATVARLVAIDEEGCVAIDPIADDPAVGFTLLAAPAGRLGDLVARHCGVDLTTGGSAEAPAPASSTISIAAFESIRDHLGRGGPDAAAERLAREGWADQTTESLLALLEARPTAHEFTQVQRVGTSGLVIDDVRWLAAARPEWFRYELIDAITIGLAPQGPESVAGEIARALGVGP